ncbi:MAG TPA: hypothetical protein VK146_09610 [Tabrizicola sp.]|nr:hypothetical protein [Tabrizicola sp.]
MSKSSASKKIEGEASEMTLEQLNAAIARMRRGWETGASSQGRRSYFKELVALEAFREARFQIEAPKRRYNR